MKIGADERTGWSSDRPRRGNAPERPADISVRGRVLEPTDRLRYTPGSLVLVAGPDPAQAEAYMSGVLEDRSALISPARVQRLLQGRATDDQAATVLEAAVTKRLDKGDAVVLILGDVSDRERWLRAAASRRRPRHLILLDGAGDAAVDELRKTLLANRLGDEGFHTAIRLGGAAANEVKKLVFRAPPKDDD